MASRIPAWGRGAMLRDIVVVAAGIALFVLAVVVLYILVGALHSGTMR